MLRTVAISFVQALAMVLGAELLWLLISYAVEKDSYELAPLILLVVYALPIFVASLRKHNAVLEILLVNLWLGWTVIGWVVALVWACDWDVEKEPVE